MKMLKGVKSFFVNFNNLMGLSLPNQLLNGFDQSWMLQFARFNPTIEGDAKYIIF